MNWGTGIFITFTVFAVFMISLVVVCVKQENIDLVTQDYYAQELVYQQQIDKMQNAKGMEALRYNAGSRELILDLPVASKGKLQLFRPDDAGLDQMIEFTDTDGEPLAVNLEDLKNGYWRAKLTWFDGDKGFYQELKMTLQ
ncbi:MAG: FixH family protein [Cyclobacteriaceae bacterium]|nr:FixH family protein [Cyclobacteriaceae bacterium]MCH8514958.1 FixH family protein [Cyclobacteriaceae bacterium]